MARQRINKIICLVMLMVSLSASLLQFHNHDCHGHAEFFFKVLEVTLGCGEGHRAHYNCVELQGISDCAGAADSKGSECALHLNPFEVFVHTDVRSDMTDNIATPLFFATLFAMVRLDDVSTINCFKKDFLFRFINLSESEGFSYRISPLRGSPNRG